MQLSAQHRPEQVGRHRLLLWWNGRPGDGSGRAKRPCRRRDLPWRIGDADAAQAGYLQGEDFGTARSRRSGCAGRSDVVVLEGDA
jgi:hypothetical protein